MEQASVIAKTSADQNEKNLSSSSDTVTIACHLQTAIRFDNIPCASGVKSIVLPGINDNLRGLSGGVLLGRGESVAVTLDRADWETSSVFTAQWVSSSLTTVYLLALWRLMAVKMNLITLMK